MENLGFFDYVKKCYENYTNFKGRARRSEYWNFVVFYSAVLFILNLPFRPLSTNEAAATTNGSTLLIIFLIIGITFYFASLLPLLAVSVRRLHDVGRSGWFLLIGLIPVVNLWLLIEFCRDSEPLDNKYGENPKKDE